MDTKRCPRCTTDKPISEFGRNAARYDGLTGYCTVCQSEAGEASRAQKRRELIEHMGGKCVRCGFSDHRALQVDHIDGGGAAERRLTVLTAAALARIVRAEPERFQLLCANCNIIKRIENGEHTGVRVHRRVAPTERVRGGKPSSLYDAVAEGYAELLRLVAERDPIERSAERLPLPRWSRHYARCLSCQRSDRKYSAFGLCTACRQRYDRAKACYPDGPPPRVTIS